MNPRIDANAVLINGFDICHFITDYYCRHAAIQPAITNSINTVPELL